MLAMHPHVLRDLVEEQDAVLGGRTTLTLDDLRAMHKLEWTIKEVLRMWPPLIMLMRKALVDLEFGGYHVPENTDAVRVAGGQRADPRDLRGSAPLRSDRYGPGREEDKKLAVRAHRLRRGAPPLHGASCSRSCSCGRCGATCCATSSSSWRTRLHGM
jgi:hypothetical protein